MSLSLSELQSRFAQALHYHASGQECAIVSNEFSADERLQIYRNNFIISLSEVLQATYPMVMALVGKECFDQLARQYVLTYPLKQGDVTHYGESFEHVFAQFPNVISEAPYLADVARFEWQLDRSTYLASTSRPDTAAAPISQLADIDESEQGNIQLCLSPGTLTFQASYAVFSLQSAIRRNNFDGLDINQKESGLIGTLANGDTWSKACSSNVAILVNRLNCRKRLSEIEPELLAHIQTLTELGIVTGFTLIDT
ncbi:DNA-binding domain-containing protein [Vibrio sp. S4M6]|uniref:HvfC/BufC N-terminal domain-containing protein n=1 Tax=Vibrio sinus TaxID=2946865 RepID=UPI00202AA3F4|nr:DNA-binding domain-containing protein [Vibrio sinus]MCL9782917.1 DNA-binding domain-containing protein [Vibrio sinus]